MYSQSTTNCGIVPHFIEENLHIPHVVPIRIEENTLFFLSKCFYLHKNEKKTGTDKEFGTDFVYTMVTYIISVSTFIRFYRLSLTLKR